MPRSESRQQVATALGFVGLIAASAVAVVLVNVARKPAATPAPSASRSPSVGACTGASPSALFRDKGPLPPPPDDTTDPGSVYVATISTYCGDLIYKLDPVTDPEAVRSFVFLAQKKFYDGLLIDRIEPARGVFFGAAPTGYSLAVSPRKNVVFKSGQLLLLDVGGGAGVHVAAPFAIAARDGAQITAVPLGAAPDGTSARANRETLARILQAGSGAPGMYIVHIEIEEFSR